MSANPGRLAQCDHPGCRAEFRVMRGEDAESTLMGADWVYIAPVTPDWQATVYCPEHRPKREYVLRIVRDEYHQYMPPHRYKVGTGQPFETLIRLLINESYDPNMTVEIISEQDLHPEEPGRPMTGPHPHNMPETWRGDGKCIVKSCGVYQT